MYKIMADLNKVMLIGRIASDLEVKKMGDSGVSVLNFSLVTNRTYKNAS
jgi:single-stranded DNA-binding protein